MHKYPPSWTEISMGNRQFLVMANEQGVGSLLEVCQDWREIESVCVDLLSSHGGSYILNNGSDNVNVDVDVEEEPPLFCFASE